MKPNLFLIMKIKSILAAMFLMLAGAQTGWAQNMTVRMTNNETHVYKVPQVAELTFSEDETVYEWVDLGLPSGTLWATCNIGANTPEEFGDYFAWGETTPKDGYDWDTYKWCNGTDETITKYCTESSVGNNGFTDNRTELLPEDDAATANWGSGWQIPSDEQLKELFDSKNTTAEWTTQNGVNGRKFTSKSNGNSIFFPATGYRYSTSYNEVGSLGWYWSRSLSEYGSSNANDMLFKSDRCYLNGGQRCMGMPVRPVRKK